MIKNLSFSDIPFAYSLTRVEGWSTLQEELEDLLFEDPKSNFILKFEDKPIGMVFGTSYKNFAFIGNFIIQKEFRHKGFGKHFFSKLLEDLRERDINTFCLDAVLEAARFYEHFGFKKICKSLRFRGVLPFPQMSKPENMKLVRDEMFDKLVEFDKSYFGGDRSVLLRRIFQRNPSLCHYLTQNGEIIGYIMGENKGNYVKIGPMVISKYFLEEVQEPTLKAFLLHSIPQNFPREAYIGVLETNKYAVSLFQNCNLEIKFHSIRMIHSPVEKFSESASIFAHAGPDRG